jgi:hypothetical protein
MQRNTRWIGLYTAILLMVATAAASAAGKQDENPSQAGKSSVYFYDVTATDTHGKGKLMVDVNQHTFVFNGQDFEPSAQIALQAKAASGDYVIFASGKATPSGNLHISGTWEAGAAPTEVVAGTWYQAMRQFFFTNNGAFLAKVACYYSTDGGVTWHESEHTSSVPVWTTIAVPLGALGVPGGALVKVHIIVVGGKDRTGSEVFQYEDWVDVWAEYTIHGTTWKPILEYDGCVSF